MTLYLCRFISNMPPEGEEKGVHAQPAAISKGGIAAYWQCTIAALPGGLGKPRHGIA